jgi:NADP-dependent 3-hydroxy acid dehydrogenase YdfG/acyl carrier protein
MTIALNGAEYVPPERVAAYEAGLADDRPLEAVQAAASASHDHQRAVQVGGAAELAGVPLATPAPAAAPVPHDHRHVRQDGGPAEVPSVPRAGAAVGHARPAAPVPDATGDVLAQHSALHTRYLDGQLDLAQRLAAAWRADGGPDTTARLRAVADLAEAMSAAHIRANEVLASLAALEQGAGPVSGAGAPRSVGPAVGAPRQIAAAEPVPSDGALRSTEATEGAPRSNGFSANGHVPAAGGAATASPAPAAPPAPDVPAAPSAPAGPDAEALRSVLVEVVADKTGYPPAMVDPGLDLEADLGVDSIKRVQVLGAVQERYPQLPAIGPESLAELRTLDQIVAHFAADAPSAPATTTTPTPAPTPGAAPGPVVGDDVPRHAVELVDLPAREDGAPAFAADPVAVLVDRGGPEPDALEAALTADGWTVRRVVLPEATGCDWITPDDEDRGLPGLDDALDGRVDACLLVLRDDEDLAGSVRQLADAVLVAGAARDPLARTAAGGTRAAFVAVTRADGGLGLLGHRIAADAVLAGVGGLVKTLAREAPALFCRSLDIAPVDAPATAAAVVLAELTDAATDVVEVGVDADGNRYTIRVADRPAPATGAGTPVGPDDVVVVTGGARGVTADCVRELARRVAPEIVLLGRSTLTEEPAWAGRVPDDGLTAAAAAALAEDGARPSPRDVAAARDAVLAQREVRATLEAVRTHGATVRYAAVDVTDADQVRDALADVAHRATVVVHAAGALADAKLPDKTRGAVHRVLAPKLVGLHHVTDALRDAPLHTVALFGSVAGVHGNPGQADYALANEALARFGASADRHRAPRHVTTLSWGAWDGGMVSPDLREHFRALGVPLIDPEDGARAFADHLAGGATGWVLIGAPEPLTGDEPRSPALPAATSRDLEPLRGEPVLAAHRIGADPVLPATVALGWMIDATERRSPDRVVTGVRDLAVRSGVIYGADPAGHLVAEIGAPDADGAVPVSVLDARSTRRYSATLQLGSATAGTPQVRTDWPRDAIGRGTEDGPDLYRSAVLFHGPALQGIRRVLEQNEDRVVLECSLPPTSLARGAWAGRRHDPVTADVVLQAALVLGHRLLDAACLPLAVGRIELGAVIPAGEPFVLLVENPRASATILRCDVTVCAVDGQVLQRWVDVEVVTTPDLGERFAQGVASWSGAVAGSAR